MCLFSLICLVTAVSEPAKLFGGGAMEGRRAVEEVYSYSAAEVAALKAEVKQLRAEAADKIREDMATQQQLDNAAEELRSEHERAGELEAKVGASELDLAEARGRIDEQAQQLAAREAELASRAEALQTTAAELERLQKMRLRIETEERVSSSVPGRMGSSHTPKSSARSSSSPSRRGKQGGGRDPPQPAAVSTEEVALSARSFTEVEALKLRDDALHAKTREIWLVEEQRAKLSVQLDQVEEEVERMQETLMEKDVSLSRRKETVDRLERELKQLMQTVKKAKGQERAMEVVSKQNASLLQLLQAQEQRTEEEAEAKRGLELQLAELKVRHRKHLENAAKHEAQMLKEKAEARRRSEELAVLHARAEKEHRQMKEELEVQVATQRGAVEAMQDELRQRRSRQYEQLAKLQDIESELRREQDERERLADEVETLQSWKEEQEQRLAEAREWRASADSEIAETKKRAVAEVDEAAARVDHAESEQFALQKQVKELCRTVLQLVDKHAEAERGTSAVREAAQAKQSRIDELKEQVSRLAAEATQQGRAREHATVQSEMVRQQFSLLRGKAQEQLQLVKHEQERADGQMEQLHAQCKRYQGKQAELRRSKQHVMGLHARSFFKQQQLQSDAVRARVDHLLDLSCCGLDDDDVDVLSELLRQHFQQNYQEQQRRRQQQQQQQQQQPVDSAPAASVPLQTPQLEVCLAGNAIGDAGAASLGTLLSDTSCSLKALDLRQNLISMDGVRVLAEALEPRSSGGGPDGGARVEHVYVHQSGKIEALGAGGAAPADSGVPAAEAQEGNRVVQCVTVVDVRDNAAPADGADAASASNTFVPQEQRISAAAAAKDAKRGKAKRGRGRKAPHVEARELATASIYGADQSAAFIEPTATGMGSMALTSAGSRKTSPMADGTHEAFPLSTTFADTGASTAEGREAEA